MENMLNDVVNTSGQGSQAVVPPEVSGWNWGAFLMHWVWAIGNKTWIGLLALPLGIIMAIVLGVKGSEWAWQNRKWESVGQFKATQKVWAYWGLGLFILSLLAIPIFAAILFPVFAQARNAAMMNQP